MDKKKIRRRGFTLPEVLVTVTVVAVLAAVVVPAVTQFASKGDAPATMEDLNAMRTAVTSYVVANRTYPATLSDLAPYAAQFSLSGTTSAATFKSNGYGFTVANTISQPTDPNNSVVMIAVTLNTAAKADCLSIDAAIDNGTGGTSGSFRYATNTTPCTGATYYLMPK